MKLQLTPEVKTTLQNACGLLKGASRRLFMASVVVQLDRGGQRLLAQELGWNRDLIRKGLHELRSGITCADAFSARGRKNWEDLHPKLVTDIKEIVDSHCETDPTFRTTRLYRRLTAGEVRRQLLEDKGYQQDQIPCERSMRDLLARLGFHPRKVVKSKPLRKIKETDAVFDQVHLVNQLADADSGTIRLSIDSKAVVAIGDFSRGGTSIKEEKTLDHDFAPDVKPQVDTIWNFQTRHQRNMATFHQWHSNC